MKKLGKRATNSTICPSDLKPEEAARNNAAGVFMKEQDIPEYLEGCGKIQIIILFIFCLTSNLTEYKNNNFYLITYYDCVKNAIFIDIQTNIF